ncbi:P-loop containing nucleoside triphosphate hydrolase protein [Rhizophagus irregularis]|uniref:DNA 3'-5' helicase n=1 Tax=Rhizophagus irregularis TaxID=588596 RepID=A0A2N0PDE6_9GLOM|nr:P-loop containing nucleoside triphosphate hydrolase protein [Rhizophagus irregularis]
MAIEKRNQTKAEKIINQKKNLETFDFTQDLVPYGRQVYKEINKSKFIPSFANLVPSFKTSCLKCIGYQSFAKKYSSGLCNLCGFLLKNNLPSSLPKLRNQQASSSSSCRELAISSIVQFFGFERYRELQCESIESFLSEQNTLTILRTGRGKSLIYAAASILSQALTVVFTPQKSLMDNQREMVKFGIPAAMLYASSEQSPQVQEKIVSEIASGKIRQKSKISEYATKYIRGLQFVIDETHCIISYEGFQDSWHQLKCIKQDFPSVPLLALTATCSPEDAAKIETVLKRPNMKVIRSPIIHPTSAFGMGINVSDITLIIHTTLPLSNEQYVQEIGRAGCLGQGSKAIMFYSREDIRTLLAIIGGGQENLSNHEEMHHLSDTNVTLNIKKRKIMLMALYADSIYECRQQLTYQSFQWLYDPPILQCMICDNCLRQEKDTPSIYDAQSEAVRMIRIVMLLLQHIRDPQNNMHYITRKDIINVFYNNKNNNVNQKNLNKLSLYSEARIQTWLRPQKLVCTCLIG